MLKLSVITGERSETRDPARRAISIDCGVLDPRFRGDDTL
jgi:hypothetical protein